MKAKLLGMVVASALGLAGCADVAERLGEPLRNPPPQVQTYAADPRAVYDAARSALDAMGYRFTRGGPAQGYLEGLSEIMPGDGPESTKQVALKAEFHPAAGGGTEVTVTVREMVQQDAAGAGASPAGTPNSFSTRAQPPIPVADTFLRAIQQALNHPAAKP